VAGDRWLGSHGPAGRGLSLMWSSGPLECVPGVHEGCRFGGVEIVCVCGSLAWQDLGAWSQQKSCGPVQVRPSEN
jgi:hypothetical protein